MAGSKCCKPRKPLTTSYMVAYDLGCALLEKIDTEKLTVREVKTNNNNSERFEIRSRRNGGERLLHVHIHQLTGKAVTRKDATATCVLEVMRCGGSDKVIFKKRITRASIRSKAKMMIKNDAIANKLIKLCKVA